MRLPDANVLLYATDSAAPRHAAARVWLDAQLSGTETTAFAWSVLLAFLRLSTNARVYAKPYSPDEALDVIDGWLAQPAATVVHPTERHAAVLRDLIGTVGTAGNLTSDAHLAALAIEHGAVLVTFDADFGRFGGVRWERPDA